MKKIFTIAALALTGIALAACSSNSNASSSSSNSSDDALAKIQKAGVLNVGTEGTYSPYSYHDESGKLVGYDVEVAEKVAEKLGVKAKFTETKWDSLLAAIDAGRIDTVANQVGVTDERKEKYDFTTPYTYTYGALIVKGDNKDIKSFDDIKGKKSANTNTSNYGKSAVEYGATLVPVDGFAQSVELITSGRADLTLNANIAFLDYKKQHPDADIKVVAEDSNQEASAFPVKKGNEKLVKEIDKALDELAKDGTLTELSNKYFGSDVSKAK